MAVSLTKGANVSLTKAAPSMTEVVIGLSWDVRATDGVEFDLDASVFMVGENGKVVNDGSFVFYNNTKSPCGNVEHLGDNRTGAGDGDDEQVIVKLNMLGADMQRLVFAVTIHDAEVRRQTFGQVSNAAIRVVDKANGTEIARYDLSEDSAVETAMIFGELYRNGTEWKFKAIGQGFTGGLLPLASSYGVNLG